MGIVFGNPRGLFATLTAGCAAALLLSGATARGQSCAGDCDGDGQVRVSELITGVRIALEVQPLATCTSFDTNGDERVAVNELVSATRAALDGCATGGPPPGTRRFSLDPQRSQIISRLSPEFSFPIAGFSGFLELRAGPGVFGTDIHYVDVTDTSEYLSVDIPPASVTLCIRPLRDQLPVERAGVLYCGAGFPVDFDVRQVHVLGVANTCAAGARQGQACGNDEECPDGSCFDADDCAAQSGRVEGAADAHPGVCNGPIVGTLLSEASPAGALLIAADTAGGQIHGLPAEITSEAALPCGDEEVPGMSAVIALTTGRSQAEVLDFNAEPGATLSDEIRGAEFDCSQWTRENGPGTLVLATPVLDNPGVTGSADLISIWVLVD